MGGRSGSELIGRSVLCRGIELGRVADLVLDSAGGRVLGLEVACGDEGRRFLPFGAAAFGAGGVETRSPLMLFDRVGLDYYRSHGSVLGELLGTRIDGGRVVDVLVASDGTVTASIAPDAA